MIKLAKKIINELSEHLTEIKKDYADERFDYEMEGMSCGIDASKYMVLVTGYYKDEYDESEQTSCILLKLFIIKKYRQIQITNIFLPTFMHHKGIGKKLISIIFTQSEKSGYGLFLVDMVNSFYQRMINRGALPCECDDAVQIVSATKLD